MFSVLHRSQRFWEVDPGSAIMATRKSQPQTSGSGRVVLRWRLEPLLRSVQMAPYIAVTSVCLKRTVSVQTAVSGRRTEGHVAEREEEM
jgi:hypothetical protein